MRLVLITGRQQALVARNYSLCHPINVYEMMHWILPVNINAYLFSRLPWPIEALPYRVTGKNFNLSRQRIGGLANHMVGNAMSNLQALLDRNKLCVDRKASNLEISLLGLTLLPLIHVTSKEE